MDSLGLSVQKTSAVPCVCLLATRVRRGLIGSVSAEDLNSSYMCVFWLPRSDMDLLGLTAQAAVQKTSAVHGVCLLVTRVRRGLTGPDSTGCCAEDLSSSWCVSFGYQGQTWTRWTCQVRLLCRRPQQFMVCVFWLPGSDVDSLDLSGQAAVQKTSAVHGVCLLVTRVRHGLAGPVSAGCCAEDLSSSWCVSFGYQGQTWTRWACQHRLLCRRPQRFHAASLLTC